MQSFVPHLHSGSTSDQNRFPYDPFDVFTGFFVLKVPSKPIYPMSVHGLTHIAYSPFLTVSKTYFSPLKGSFARTYNAGI